MHLNVFYLILLIIIIIIISIIIMVFKYKTLNFKCELLNFC